MVLNYLFIKARKNKDKSEAQKVLAAKEKYLQNNTPGARCLKTAKQVYDFAFFNPKCNTLGKAIKICAYLCWI